MKLVNIYTYNKAFIMLKYYQNSTDDMTYYFFSICFIITKYFNDTDFYFVKYCLAIRWFINILVRSILQNESDIHLSISFSLNYQ